MVGCLGGGSIALDAPRIPSPGPVKGSTMCPAEPITKVGCFFFLFFLCVCVCGKEGISLSHCCMGKTETCSSVPHLRLLRFTAS